MSTDFQSALESFFDGALVWPSIFNVGLVILVGIILIWLIGRATNWFLRRIIAKTDAVTDNEKQASYRRAETTIYVTAAIMKISLVAIMFFLAWHILIPNSAPAAVVGASALFVVLSGATIAPLLKDITAGSIMLAERWYGVGDYLTVEPFADVQGVVEQVSLRSTKLRGLSGEVIWVHNQHIMGAKVKYRGVSTIALDVFVKEKEKALELLQDIVDIVPKGPMLVLDGLRITEVEKLNKSMWRVELMGQTVPGREWLIEKFSTEAIKDADDQHKQSERIIVYGPISRYVDATAEKRFKRAIKQTSNKRKK